MAKFNKENIGQNFSNSANEYERLAILQKNAAKTLVNFVTPHLAEKKEDKLKIIDLGCGTGFVGDELFSQTKISAKNIDLTLCDLAKEMLQFCAKKFPQAQKILCDFENEKFQNQSFDLMISSFSMQWLENFEQFFSNSFSALNKSGILAFALPIQGSLEELNRIQNLRINDFPKIEEITAAYEKAGFNKIFSKEEKIEQSFPNKISATKFLKKIGANSSNKPIKILKKSEFSSNKNTPNSSNFKVSWLVNYLILQKNNQND